MNKFLAILLTASLVASPCLADIRSNSNQNMSALEDDHDEEQSTNGLKTLAGGFFFALGAFGFLVMRSEHNSGSEYGLETDTTKQQLAYLTIMAVSGVSLYRLSKDEKHEIAFTRKNNVPAVVYNFRF